MSELTCLETREPPMPTSALPVTPPSIEPSIGELAAAAACLLAQAAGETESGRIGGIPNAKEVG